MRDWGNQWNDNFAGFDGLGSYSKSFHLNFVEFLQSFLPKGLKPKEAENVKTHVIASEDERNLHKSLFDKDKYNPRVIQGKGRLIVFIKEGNPCKLV